MITLYTKPYRYHGTSTPELKRIYAGKLDLLSSLGTKLDFLHRLVLEHLNDLEYELVGRNVEIIPTVQPSCMFRLKVVPMVAE